MDIIKLRKIYELKSVGRANQANGRPESSAEHTFSCLILADFFLDEIKIDKAKVFDLILYHDVVEVESGDNPSHLDIDEMIQSEKESDGAKVLKKILPQKAAKKFYTLFLEFEAQKTKEARFAKAIDKLDAVLQALDKSNDWKLWPKEVLIKKKKPFFEEFPIVLKAFYDIIEYLEKENYFD